MDEVENGPSVRRPHRQFFSVTRLTQHVVHVHLLSPQHACVDRLLLEISKLMRSKSRYTEFTEARGETLPQSTKLRTSPLPVDPKTEEADKKPGEPAKAKKGLFSFLSSATR